MGKNAFLLLTFIFVFTACSTFNKQAPQNIENDQYNSTEAELLKESEKEATTIYYDFDDILVPKDMKLIADDSLLFETPSVKAGVLLFEGRVEPMSLFNFFINNMPKDNWELRSYFKYGRYIMVYEKPDRDCVISLNERSLTTQLQIWVTPRTKNSTPSEAMGPQTTTLRE